jgi:hypothetical protein
VHIGISACLLLVWMFTSNVCGLPVAIRKYKLLPGTQWMAAMNNNVLICKLLMKFAVPGKVYNGPAA